MCFAPLQHSTHAYPAATFHYLTTLPPYYWAMADSGRPATATAHHTSLSTFTYAMLIEHATTF